MKMSRAISPVELKLPIGGTWQDYERWLILTRLVSCNYRLGKTATSVGINRNTLRSKLVDYGIIGKKKSKYEDRDQLPLFA